MNSYFERVIPEKVGVCMNDAQAKFSPAHVYYDWEKGSDVTLSIP